MFSRIFALTIRLCSSYVVMLVFIAAGINFVFRPFCFQSLPFPAVTLCNFNALKYDELLGSDFTALKETIQKQSKSLFGLIMFILIETLESWVRVMMVCRKCMLTMRSKKLSLCSLPITAIKSGARSCNHHSCVLYFCDQEPRKRTCFFFEGPSFILVH